VMVVLLRGAEYHHYLSYNRSVVYVCHFALA